MALEKQVEQFNKNNDAELTKILLFLEDTFKNVENARKLLLTLDINNLDRIKKLQLEMTAHYGVLREWYVRIDGIKKNKEAAYKQWLQNEAESKKEKFNASAADQSASLYVANERKTRDRIWGKLDLTLETIKTCRNLLNEKQYPSQTSLTA